MFGYNMAPTAWTSCVRDPHYNTILLQHDLTKDPKTIIMRFQCYE